MKQLRPYPRAIVTKKAARSLKAGHPWVFAGEVIRVEPGAASGKGPENGDAVDVFEENGTWQGLGLISERSTIRIRIVTRNANDRLDEAFWERRIRWAWEHRVAVMGPRSLPGEEPDTSCCRVLFSEADGIPGLVADRYEDVIVTQVGTVGMERLRPTIYPLLLDVLREDGQEVSAIYERCDSPSRTKEGLLLRTGWWEGTPVAGDAHVLARENGIAYDVDLANGQKTGFFLDQKYNRRAVRELAGGRRVLDCFCHVGTFGLNAAAGGAEYVRCVDVSQSACESAQANARLNGFEDRVGVTCDDAFEYLGELSRRKARLHQEGGPFDLVVLDPPAFTKSRSTVSHAARGYRQINYDALRLLPRGGYLATCSCSRFMTRDLLAHAIAEAAHDANVQLKQVEERQQAPDHPILWGVPETHYLDFFIFQVV